MNKILSFTIGLIIAFSVSSCSSSKTDALANVHNISVAVHGMDSIIANGNTINLNEDYIFTLFQNASPIISNLLEDNSGDEIIFFEIPNTYYSIINPFICPLKKEQVQEVVEGVEIDAILVLCTTQSATVETLSIRADKEIHKLNVRIFGTLYDRNGNRIWSDDFSSDYESEELIGIYREDAIGASRKNISIQFDNTLFFSAHQDAFKNSLTQLLNTLERNIATAKES